ncbi:MAG: hypothetical protein AB1595_04010 [bacterium]
MGRLKPDADIKDIALDAYNLFNKWGFNDGDSIHSKDHWIVELYAKRLVSV